MKRVLITGARGFIGSRCVPRIAARGLEVHALSSREAAGGPAIWHRGDLLVRGVGEALIKGLRPSHLLHLAWIAEPGAFWSSPLNLAWLETSVRLVSSFYAEGGTRAVGVGTCAEYAPSMSPCREDATPLGPNTIYGHAKAGMYHALRAAAHGRGTWAWARLFFPYGAGEPSGRFIPSVIEGLLRRVPVSCTDGKQVRDFIHADDVAEALASMVDSGSSAAYNVGTGEGSSLRDVAAAITAELGHGDLLRFGERQRAPHEPEYLVADMTRARNELGWTPKIGLKEGIQLTIAARGSMKITIDTDGKSVTIQEGSSSKTFSLYEKRPFELLSDLWLRLSWVQKYSYTFTWMGRPIIQHPEDLVRLQEVIYSLKPDVVIETGIAHGGSLMLSASLMKAMGRGRVVVGVDVEIRPHNRKAIEAHELFPMIRLIEGDSTAPQVVAQAASHVRPGDTVLVILDSNHSREHVRKELEAYHHLVSKDSYIVATDGIMQDLADAPRGQPAWTTDNPAQAARDFAAAHPEFRIESPPWRFNESPLSRNVTAWPDAWLKRIA